MLKPPHDVARRAYELALPINPNNHALDGGRASSAMEKEAVAVDPLDAIVELRRRYDVRVHADAAYGGYFLLVKDLAAETRRAFDRIAEAASVVIDPHKHGLQPYGCGCVLFRDPAVGRLYYHDSPYTYYTSTDVHLGEISLECSRPGAAAVALWATQRLFPLVPNGEFAKGLASGRK